uniref:Cerato-platanin 12 n=1 Tax=Moniliophthora perniciosa TaxID=153609 RepID=S4UQ17_MONPR|nr:cerato-platanin 12 [Moniliophthora perniciosa]
MKFIAAIAILATSAAALSIKRQSADGTLKLRYINEYDNSDFTLSDHGSCSNILSPKGINTVGDVNKSVDGVNVYPGGAFPVKEWNSDSCGTCWKVSYDDNGTVRTIRVVAVDTAQEGFNVAQKAMDELTDGKAYEKGFVTVTAEQLSADDCKIGTN